MPTTLTITKTMLPPGSKSTDDATFVDVGTVTVQDNGDLDVQTDDAILAQYIKTGLRVTASMRGGDVPKSDPDYALAVADSIGRGTLWRYSVRPPPGASA